MGKLFALLTGGLARLFTDKIIGFVALKIVLAFLFITVVPILLNNFLYDMIEIIMGFATSQIGTQATLNGAMSFTGFVAWVIDCFQLPQALSVMVSALILRLILSMIPFVRL